MEAPPNLTAAVMDLRQRISGAPAIRLRLFVVWEDEPSPILENCERALYVSRQCNRLHWCQRVAAGASECCSYGAPPFRACQGLPKDVVHCALPDDEFQQSDKFIEVLNLFEYGLSHWRAPVKVQQWTFAPDLPPDLCPNADLIVHRISELNFTLNVVRAVAKTANGGVSQVRTLPKALAQKARSHSYVALSNSF